ncbi:MAG: hypothetical protein GF344_16895 [Chitinivibrionales bacterium]|nr:hypothetical protein [Chitinivibrionales bacterium]MBD3358360.1 hypothetical protein [Chitinivibrionales bacterium]
MDPTAPATTNIHPAALVFVLTAAALVFVLPRRFAFAPLLASACYITVGQVVMVGPLDFTIHRILLLVGWVRILVRGEWDIERLNMLDRIIIVWAMVNLSAHTLLVGTVGAFINRLGFTYNALGFYFLFRVLIVDTEDIGWLYRSLAVLLIPLAFAMLFENLHGRNLFAVFGGVPAEALVRDGEVRAQAAFRHPILAGSLGATSIPLLLSLWWDDGTPRLLVGLGLTAACAVTLLPSSSGPIMTMVAGVGAMLAWRVRYRLWVFRWATLAGLLGLQLVMNAPIWFLIDRVGDLLGGEGYHRSLLIDQAVRHLDEWWLLGTTRTAHWMPFVLPINPDMADITNYYLRMGVDGGLATMALFVLLITAAFRVVGRTTSILDGRGAAFGAKIRIWALGAALTGHVFAFISVSYFDQIVMFWYLLLALIATTDDIGKKVTSKKKDVMRTADSESEER